MPHECFPWILVRGHGHLRPANAQLPWPRGAAQPQKRGRSRLPNAAVFCLGSRGSRAKPQAEPNGTKGRRTLRKFWHLKGWSFGNCGHSNCFLNSRNIGFETSWGHRVGWKNATFGILLKSCQLIIKLKHTSTLENKSVSYWDTARLKRNNPPCFTSLLLVFHVVGWTSVNSQMKSKNFGSTRETFRNANAPLEPLEWKLPRLKEQFFDCDGRAIFWQAEILDRKAFNWKSYFSTANRSVGSEPVAITKRATHVYPGTPSKLYKNNFH